jgi:uncharacterized protein DUF3828
MRFLMPLFIALATASPALAAPAEPAGARAFIEHVYAGHPRNTPRAEQAYYALFDRDLRALIVKNDHYAEGDIGPLDGDPICDCQDDAGFSHRLVSVTGDAHAAVAKVRNIFAPPEPRNELVTYQLVMQDGRWRIADIGTAERPSLKRWLAAELAKPH